MNRSSNGGPRRLRLFDRAEEAWFWYMRTEKARTEGARAARREDRDERPCDPDDVYRCVTRLYQDGALLPLHLEVLSEYGYLDRYPSKSDDGELMDTLIWMDAFDTLEPLLVQKGIVA